MKNSKLQHLSVKSFFFRSISPTIWLSVEFTSLHLRLWFKKIKKNSIPRIYECVKYLAAYVLDSRTFASHSSACLQ